MEDSVAEEVEASNREINPKDEKKKGSIQIVKLEFTEADKEATEEPKPLNPIPG